MFNDFLIINDYDNLDEYVEEYDSELKDYFEQEAKEYYEQTNKYV